jgi:hypothetical protein
MAAKKPQANKLWLKEESASNAKKKNTQEKFAKKPQANKLWLKEELASKAKKANSRNNCKKTPSKQAMVKKRISIKSEEK